MSNKPLHIRCRPKNLEDIVGNTHIVKCLEQIIKRKNRPKVYLLHGNYGCLRGDTVIFDPIDKSNLTVKERWEKGNSFNVFSCASSGKMEVATALPPVQYPKDSLFRVETSESTFFVTSEHQFRLHTGRYLSLRELSGLPYAQFPLLSMKVSSQEAQLQDEFNVAIIKEIELVGQEEYYDFHVPIYNNYWAGGLFHHNCGKTTIAKIIARNVGCNTRNIIEINAGNEKGIETARELIRILKHQPLMGGCRFIILDEAQMLTSQFQQAMLTTLEDTPDNVYFALCTTDPQKIIKTLKSRCLQLEVKPLSDKEMKGLLTEIIKEEGLKIAEKVLSTIIRNANGIPRDALLLMEKIVGLKGEDIINENLSVNNEMEHQVIDLCRAIMFSKDWNKTRQIMQSILASHASNLEQVRLAILGYISAIALKDNKPNMKATLVYECFKQPFYGNATKADFIFSCIYVLKS